MSNQPDLQAWRGGLDRLLTIACVAVTVFVVAVAVVRYRESRRPPSALIQERVTNVPDWRQYAKDGIVVGPEMPEVTIVVFSDFRCRHCRSADSALSTLRQRHPSQLSVVYRHFAVSDALSADAAVAAECAYRAGVFDNMRGVIYAAADSLATDIWGQLAEQAGVHDTVSFLGCMVDRTAREVVSRDLQAAFRLRVRGTPTLLVNDNKILGNPGLRFLEYVVREELRGQGREGDLTP